MTEEPEDSVTKGAIRDDRDVRRMFDRIVGRYDLVNRVMTGGRDVAWRRKVAEQAAAAGSDGRGASVLDVATGTGDLAFACRDAGAELVTGVDFSEGMIAKARQKASQRGDPTTFLVGDGMALPFEDETFDACTIGFGLRNMEDYAGAVREMRRVLRPGGQVVILEMTPLRRPVLGALFRVYFEHVVPVLGGVLSGDLSAYRYLPQSVAAFPPADELAHLLREAGLRDVSYQLLGLGTVAIHSGVRDDG